MGIVLVGYRGSGKTTVGRLLAARLACPFLDTDELVVQRAGTSIREIFASKGEPAFRDLEAQAVHDAIMLDDAVISLGGGAVLRPESRTRLIASPHHRVYLRCPVEVLSSRIAADPNSAANRPALTAAAASASDPLEIARLLALREPLYREVMTIELDAGGASPEALAAQILATL